VLVGERFGTYRIEGLIGRGGMGEVYRAYDETHKRIVALKVLPAQLATDETYRARFRRESELAARLREAHVIPIHSYGEIEGRLFLDMRLVDGSDLGSVLKAEGLLSAQRAVDVVGQVARALDAAHVDGLIHRDVKPSNVLMAHRDENSEHDFVYLVDFGIARATEDDGLGLTLTGAAMGSFDYMAPERFLEEPVDRRADVYSLACLLFECLTGQRPFSGDGPALMNKHLNAAPPRATRLVSGIPTALDDVVARGMAKQPQDRYARAGDLAAEARRAMRSAPAWAAVADHEPSAPTVRHAPVVAGPPPWAVRSPGIQRSQQPAGRSPVGPVGRSPVGPVGQAPVPRPTATSGMTKSRAALIVMLVAVLVAAATIWIFVLTRPDDDPTDAATPSASDSAESSSTQASEAPTTTDGAPEAEPVSDLARLIGLLPPSVAREQCEQMLPLGNGDLAGVDCGNVPVPTGPTSSYFYLYPDDLSVQTQFEQWMEILERPLLDTEAAADCLPLVGYLYYIIDDGARVGYLTCYVDEADYATIEWTDVAFGLSGYVSIYGGDDPLGALDTLFDWWLNEAFVPVG